ncbi:MAG: actin-like protein arp8 [Piccolia ochrophora]|nr:MAG: actin-like protein arp8 [Piccolia ochrophora]
MVGKKSGKALLREEGLERTDNSMDLTTWPQVSMINQKNYYTEYLKRDDQILPLRLQNEESRNMMTKVAKDRDRALAHADRVDLGITAPDVAMEDAEGNGGPDQETLGSKVIVIHPGSQNLRIGLASDALPKSVPMVLARQWRENESEENGGEPRPKRLKTEDGEDEHPEIMFGEEFSDQYIAMSASLKVRMRNNKRRVLPNSKELVVNYNRRTTPETISEHNDPLRIEWTEILSGPKAAPETFTGHAALRIPDNSRPRYKLYWPLRNGWYNESPYLSRTLLQEDIAIIIEDALKNQLELPRKKDWGLYDCVFVIPDLYDRNYVTASLEMLLREFRFARVCFVQESLAATFGAGFSSACIVDIGAQKTSICCVEEGMCIENSRINIKYGGADVTETFVKMMLFDLFPYADINLNRRYDFLLAEELKQKFCTMNEAEISVQLYDFHLRASGQDTRKYTFKTYDEVILAPMGYFQPAIFDHSEKLRGRRKLIERSYDIYDGSPNDPFSSAQQSIYQALAPTPESVDPSAPVATNGEGDGPTKPYSLANRLNDKLDATPRSSVAGSPAPEENGTPQPGAASTPAPGMNGTPTVPNPMAEKIYSAEERDRILPILPLDTAILTSITHSAQADERKTRDFLGGIMVIGGGGAVPGFLTFLEERMRALRPAFAKEIMIGSPPRELDPQVIVWKGGSVFGKLQGTNDSWIGQMEYDRLGSRLLAYKCPTIKAFNFPTMRKTMRPYPPGHPSPADPAIKAPHAPDPSLLTPTQLAARAAYITRPDPPTVPSPARTRSSRNRTVADAAPPRSYTTHLREAPKAAALAALAQSPTVPSPAKTNLRRTRTVPHASHASTPTPRPQKHHGPGIFQDLREGWKVFKSRAEERDRERMARCLAKHNAKINARTEPAILKGVGAPGVPPGRPRTPPEARTPGAPLPERPVRHTRTVTFQEPAVVCTICVVPVTGASAASYGRTLPICEVCRQRYAPNPSEPTEVGLLRARAALLGLSEGDAERYERAALWGRSEGGGHAVYEEHREEDGFF